MMKMANNMNDTILRAYRGEKTAHVPAWYMRQAGRSQQEYLNIRKEHTLFEITHDPELCAYVTRTPVENYGVDAAILFKDIMSPMPSIGVDTEIKAGVGPVIHNPVTNKADVVRIGEINPEKDVPYVLDTIRLLTREQLNVPLIGFCGAPFTLASYMIEGGPSKKFSKTKTFMYSQPEAWSLLMEKLGDMVLAYTKAQIDAGVQAFQIFDSWIGALNETDYRMYVLPVMERIFSELKTKNVPLILFGVHTRHLLPTWNELPIDVIGLDWRTSIQDARAMGITKVLQGNLDPAVLLADWNSIETRTKAILDESMRDGRHVFNLGHGVTPDVAPDVLKRLTELIHDYTAR